MSDFHFIAIGGVGQSALAKILLRLGYSVSGSDINESKYTKLVSELGAKVFIGHNEKNILGKPKVVVSSAIKENNPELIKARELNLEVMHRSDCLNFISKEFPCFIGLSGTHGKTTTSGLLSFILENLKVNPSYAIGGIIPKLNINAQAHKDSKYFVAELDESDGSIVKYNTDILLINNLEADHLDHYKNGLSDILDTFKIVVDRAKTIFINADDDGVQKLQINNPITYGINNSADYEAKNIEFKDLESSFDVYKKGELLGRINLIIPGVHNIYNALGIISILDYLGFEFDSYNKYFCEFSGMGRRFQIVANDKGVKIIDDYAHHPNEIKSTLNAIQNVSSRKVVIFQPHRYTRLKGLWNEFLESFNNIDKLFVLDVFNAGDEFDPEFNSKNFVQAIEKKGINAIYIKGSIASAAKEIAPKINKGDILLTLGAGDITKIGGEINGLLTD